MDAAGKDGAIKHVMSGVNPQGCDVHAFKAPSNEELDHDYLWRAHKCIPSRGKIGIFNRSYYEEVLVVRVHPPFLKAEKLPDDLITKHIWDERYEDINAFERYLTRNGVVIRKFFLHVSKEEQKKRFLERLEDPKKNWKFSMADVQERAFWKDYQEAYEEMIQHTATKHAPWYIIPPTISGLRAWPSLRQSSNRWTNSIFLSPSLTKQRRRNCRPSAIPCFLRRIKE